MSVFNLFKKTPSGTAPAYLVAGLGNPGREYAETRHNAGFLAIDRLAGSLGAEIKNAKFHALVGRAEIGGKSVLLMKPQTMMNASGIAVSEAASFYKIPAERIVVLCDDISLAPGKIRVRRKGSDGGQRGLRSIIRCLGTEDVARIKIGVGERPSRETDLADWVLGKIPPDDRKAIDARLDDVCGAVALLLDGKTEEAMSRYNG